MLQINLTVASVEDNNKKDNYNKIGGKMVKLTSTMNGDKVIFHIDIDPSDKEKDWCVVISSKSNYAGGFDVPSRARVLEYIFKVDKFCGIGSQSIQKEYLMPGEYLAMLGIGSEKMVKEQSTQIIDITTEKFGAIMAKFEIHGQSITEKDINSAKEILSCLADIFEKNKKKGEQVFDNMMLEPMFSTIVELINNVANKKTIFPYVDVVKNRIILMGPTIREGKYFWPMLKDGKYVEYAEY